MLPIAFAVVIGVIAASCSLDPWTAGEAPTDIITITKTTSARPAKEGEKLLKSQVGVVHMSHKVHQDKGLTCIECHHKKNNPEREKKCAKCHYGENGYETMHGLCVDCHIKRREGPVKCKQCH
jgi:hypothetical protein